MAITKVTSSVVGSGSATDGYVLTADGSGNSAWEAAAGGGVDGIVSSADATAITIDSSENVGIGETSPDESLVINGGVKIKGTNYLSFTNTSDQTYIRAPASNVLAFGTDSIERMRIAGNNVLLNGGNDARIVFGTGGAGAAISNDANWVRGESDSMIYNCAENGEHKFEINGTEVMRCVYTGNAQGTLRIGTTSVLASSLEKAAIQGSAGLTIKTLSYNNYAPLILWNNASTANSSSILTYVAFLGLGGTQVGSVSSVGSTTSYNTSSDYRLKENVDYTWDATTRLKQLKPARFNWISDETNTLVDGFLAHEVSSIVPEAITGVKDETETNENCVLGSTGIQEVKGVTEAEWTAGKLPVLWTEDDELPDGVSVGDVREEAAYASDTTWVASHTQDVNQSIDQSKLVPLLVKTIQELEARITTLENA